MKRQEYLNIKERIKNTYFNRVINYRNWKKDVKERDNYTCQNCGNKGNSVHHIISIGLIIKFFNLKSKKDIRNCKILWNRNNGITLCERCHRKIEEEMRLKNIAIHFYKQYIGFWFYKNKYVRLIYLGYLVITIKRNKK